MKLTFCVHARCAAGGHRPWRPLEPLQAHLSPLCHRLPAPRPQAAPAGLSAGTAAAGAPPSPAAGTSAHP
eukprot:1160279-Pelagomonas_calceolata.AAC.2